MWTTAYYQSTSLFSLRPALSTASGAQSLLVPTPYAIKMALVDVAIRWYGVSRGEQWWPAIRDLEIALELPDLLVVNKTFIKIQRKADLPKQKGIDKDAFIMEKLNEGKWPLSPTIAFREFVQFEGALGIAVRSNELVNLPIAELLTLINYVGKRGSFFQIQQPPEHLAELNQRWIITTQPAESFPANGTLQVLDDCGDKLTWEQVNVFTSKPISLNRHERVLRTVVLPYKLQRSSYRYTLYKRLAE